MNTPPREPSRLPVRGTIATVGTIGALALLLSFRGGPLAPGEPAAGARAPKPLATDELMPGAVTATSGADVLAGPITISGDLVTTPWGDVQVAVTLEGGDVGDVVVLALPGGDRHSAAISDYVAPILREEAIATGSADVSVISGATYTCEAYATSLQSALDQAAGADALEPRMADAAGPVKPPTADAAASADPQAGHDASPMPTADGETVTATGEAVAIRWGDVQVAVTVQGRDVIDVETLAMPTGDQRSARINTSAEPILREEAIATDSADVSVVSGATYTSEAYAASLQSALDQLGLG
jgi:uncharacterized protein with FMN-binding domain